MKLISRVLWVGLCLFAITPILASAQTCVIRDCAPGYVARAIGPDDCSNICVPANTDCPLVCRGFHCPAKQVCILESGGTATSSSLMCRLPIGFENIPACQDLFTIVNSSGG